MVWPVFFYFYNIYCIDLVGELFTLIAPHWFGGEDQPLCRAVCIGQDDVVHQLLCKHKNYIYIYKTL